MEVETIRARYQAYLDGMIKRQNWHAKRQVPRIMGYTVFERKDRLMHRYVRELKIHGFYGVTENG